MTLNTNPPAILEFELITLQLLLIMLVSLSLIASLSISQSGGCGSTVPSQPRAGSTSALTISGMYAIHSHQRFQYSRRERGKKKVRQCSATTRRSLCCKVSVWLLGQALILGGHLFCCLLLLLIEGCTLSIDLSLNEKSLIYNNREEVKSPGVCRFDVLAERAFEPMQVYTSRNSGTRRGPVMCNCRCIKYTALTHNIRSISFQIDKILMV